MPRRNKNPRLQNKETTVGGHTAVVTKKSSPVRRLHGQAGLRCTKTPSFLTTPLVDTTVTSGQKRREHARTAIGEYRQETVDKKLEDLPCGGHKRRRPSSASPRERDTEPPYNVRHTKQQSSIAAWQLSTNRSSRSICESTSAGSQKYVSRLAETTSGYADVTSRQPAATTIKENIVIYDTMNTAAQPFYRRAVMTSRPRDVTSSYHQRYTELVGPTLLGNGRPGAAVNVVTIGNDPSSFWPQQKRVPTRTQSVTDPNYTVLLVNSDIEETSVVRPEKKDNASQTHVGRRSTVTLESLRTGVLSYTQTKRYEDGSLPEDYLEAFCCKLPKNKKYYFYKRVRIVDTHVTGGAGSVPKEHRLPEEVNEGFDSLYLTFELIKCYVKCFATLAEFSFEFSLSAPWTNSGLPNVLVVDKVWNYNGRVYVPSYEPIEGDLYTDYVVSSLKKFYGCETIEFISTLHTALFANHDVLRKASKPVPSSLYNTLPQHSRPQQQPPQKEFVKEEPAIGPSTETPAVDVQKHQHERPLKKRKHVVSFSSQPNRNAHNEDTEQEMVSPRRPAPDTSEESSLPTLSNPTLIVFKQNFVRREPHLICPISVEIHLSSDVKYN